MSILYASPSPPTPNCGSSSREPQLIHHHYHQCAGHGFDSIRRKDNDQLLYLGSSGSSKDENNYVDLLDLRGRNKFNHQRDFGDN